MTTESNVNGFGWFLGAFVLGAVAGVTVALLAAPRSGRETRDRLKTAARDLEKTVEQVPGAVQRAVSKAVKAGQTAFEHAREEAS
ncbi:MAG TPA: YtxH domain-containing protein [Candidatus Polarisedimenticolia bacterium]|nr:YtxH domain-containing protein [Candidatus Polarisedimenticolia bacterium]